MAVSEADQFESLLAEDQTARDAVVRAVELSQAVLATQSTPQTAPVRLSSAASKSWLQHLAWISTSVAALLLVALALNFNRPPTVATSGPDDLANAWLEGSGDGPSEAEATNSGADDSEEDDPQELVTADPPAWMLEAVRSLHGEVPPENDEASDEEMES